MKPVAVDEKSLYQFEAELESLRQQMKIPGISAAVVQDGQLVWARGFGFADVENGIPATPETPCHLASVTKTFAAVILMQLVGVAVTSGTQEAYLQNTQGRSCGWGKVHS